ncbi:MAG: glycosyltransferase [Desulfococcaceae bacterium]
MANADLHVHSKFSKRPSQWILQKIGCPESFTDPLQIYRIAKKQGMDLITITDHNTISGALEIAHLPDTFVSEEITAYFPEDRCKIHVLAWNITEKHHGEISRIRQNIFDLVCWLHQEKIVHAIAHPLYAVNDRLTVQHFEQILLLFQNFELNGSRSAVQNQCLAQILSGLTQADMDRLADKYAYTPLFQSPWQKHLVGGSDDHSGLNIARTYTCISGAENVNEALSGIEAGRTEVAGLPSTPRTMAHNLYAIAWQFYRERFQLDRHCGRDRLLHFLDRSLRPEQEEESGLVSRIYCFFTERARRRREHSAPDTLMGLLRRETGVLLDEIPDLSDISGEKEDVSELREDKWFSFVNRVSDKVISHSANHLLSHLSGANVFHMFHTIGSAGGIYMLLAPYFVAFSHFTKDRELTDVLMREFADKTCQYDYEKNRCADVAHFTDTFYEVNGVAKTLQQQVGFALKNGKKMTIVTCDPEKTAYASGVRNFRPVGVYELPEYNEQKLFYPPFPEMLDYCYEKGFTHIHSATPGPVGLAALAIARILKLPFSGTYHTAFPQYARYLTGDPMIEELTWKFTLWYYDQMDVIYVSSQSSADELREKGIRPEKIRLIPRGIDTEFFHPSKRNGYLKKQYGIREKTRLLYVGRVSKEKNLPLLAQAFTELAQRMPDVHLIVVGDGPYLPEMQKLLNDTPCTFTGYLEGEDLSAVYASADIFVFPSTTDTFGNVVLEAQASGLPVIVTDQGGPCENMIADKTGLVIRGNDIQSLCHAMQVMAAYPELRESMGKKAREYMEDRSFENAFIRSWDFYEEMHHPETLYAKSA